MVQILSMMEQEVVGGEQEIQTMKEMLKALTTRTELQEKQHRSETEDLRLQLQQARESIVRAFQSNQSFCLILS